MAALTTSIPQKKSPARLDFLDGLRALAALWVVFSHIWISQFGMNAHTGPLGLFTNWILYSHLSVDAFIVLSGFCLILPVLKHGELMGGALTFFQRRAKRILPPCYLSLALSILLSTVFWRLDHGTWHVNRNAVIANLFLTQDLFLKWNIFNGPLWSVAVEWRIYFLFPLLVWGLSRYGHGAILIASSIIGYSLTALIFTKYPLMLMACPWYVLLFTLGICAGSVAFGNRPLRLSPTSWRFLAFACLVLLAGLLLAFPVTPQNGSDFGLHMPVIDTAAGAFIAAFLIVLSGDQRAVKPTKTLTLLSWPPLVALGQFSYSLYLTHMPLLLIFSRLLRHDAFHTTKFQNLTLLITLGLPAMLGLAYLFFLVAEKPLLKKTRQK